MRLTMKMEGLQEAVSKVSDLPKQVRFATAVALTRTAKLVAEAEVQEMRDVFDRPTPFTLRSIFVTGARPDAPTATVGIKNDSGGQRPAVSWLRWQVQGGLRTQTAYERLLVGAGAMRSDDRAVPGKGAKLDAFGNISRGQRIQILSQLRIDSSSGSTRKLTQFDFNDNKRDRRTKQNKIRRAFGKAGGQFIAFPNGNRSLLPGIYQAEGRDFGARLGYGRTGKLRPILIFVSKAEYEAERFDFHYVAQRAVQRHLQAQMDVAIKAALGSAATIGSAP